MHPSKYPCLLPKESIRATKQQWTRNFVSAPAESTETITINADSQKLGLTTFSFRGVSFLAMTDHELGVGGMVPTTWQDYMGAPGSLPEILSFCPLLSKNKKILKKKGGERRGGSVG